MMQLVKRERVGGTNYSTSAPSLRPDEVANEEAEAAVLGAVLRDPTVYASVSEMLQPGDFFMLWHGWVWYALEQISARGAAIDIVSVCDEMDALKQLGDNGMHRLSGIAAQAPSAYNVETYAGIVRDAAIRLRVLKSAEAMIHAALDRTAYREIEAFIDECNRLLFQATDQVIAHASTDMNSIVGAYFEEAEKAMTEGTTRGIPTGYGNLDDLLRGAVAGELTVLAGAEGMGKTTFALGMARNMALAGKHVAIFTLEMSKEEIARSFISMESRLPKRALKALDFSGGQWAQFVAGVGKFQDWSVQIIDEFSSLTPMQLRRRLRTLTQAQHQPIDVVIIDGLWLMEDTGGASERHQAVGNITRDLILVARDFGVPIYLMHQYNGEAGKRPDHHPLLRDLAESAGVRRNAQVILGLYRDSYYGIQKAEDVSEVHVLKDRNGSGAQGYHADFHFDVARNLYLPKWEGVRP
jgi:replicative DNA helicase